MSRKNPVIKSIKVQHKLFRITEEFKVWLLHKHEWIMSRIVDSQHSTIHFYIGNAKELHMQIPGFGEDKLVLRYATNGYRVTYYEKCLAVTDGTVHFEAMQSEEFPFNQLHLALECFMSRWNSGKPHQASAVRPNVGVFKPINLLMTPDEIVDRLEYLKYQKFIENAPAGLRETLLATKHLKVNV